MHCPTVRTSAFPGVVRIVFISMMRAVVPLLQVALADLETTESTASFSSGTLWLVDCVVWLLRSSTIGDLTDLTLAFAEVNCSRCSERTA